MSINSPRRPECRGTLTLGQTEAAKQGANHARRQTPTSDHRWLPRKSFQDLAIPAGRQCPAPSRTTYPEYEIKRRPFRRASSSPTAQVQTFGSRHNSTALYGRLMVTLQLLNEATFKSEAEIGHSRGARADQRNVPRRGFLTVLKSTNVSFP